MAQKKKANASKQTQVEKKVESQPAPENNDTSSNIDNNNNNNNNNNTPTTKLEKRTTIISSIASQGLAESNDLDFIYHNDFGRCLRVKRDFQPGELIVKCEGILHTPQTNKFQKSSTPNYCFACDDKAHAQSTCIMFKKKYLPLKALIEAYANGKFGENAPLFCAAIHFLARVGAFETSGENLQLWKENAKKKKNKKTFNPAWDIFDSEPSSTFYDENFAKKRIAQLKEGMQLFESLLPTGYKAVLSGDDLALFLNIFATHSFEIHERQQFAIFPLAALLPHSCLPNCNVYPIAGLRAQPAQLQILAKTAISKNTILTVSRLDNIIVPYFLRQRQVKKTRGIDCHCQRCSTETVDRTRSFWCTVCDGVVALNIKDNKFVCLDKNCDIPQESAKKMAEQEKYYGSLILGDETNRAQIQLPLDSLFDYRHWIVFRKFHNEILVQINDPNLRKYAMVSCVKMIRYIDSIEGPNHPEVSGLYSSLAQGYFLLKQYANAYKAYMRAADHFKITCGESSGPAIAMKKKAAEIKSVYVPKIEESDLDKIEKDMAVDKRHRFQGEKAEEKKEEEKKGEEKKEEEKKGEEQKKESKEEE